MKQKRKLPYVIAVDFDGTLCENKWPVIGMPNTDLISYLRCEQECKGTKVILWTCRHGRSLKQALKWCKEQGLIFDAVNKNLPEVIKHFGSDTRKIFAHEYIDDKNTEWPSLPFRSDNGLYEIKTSPLNKEDVEKQFSIYQEMYVKPIEAKILRRIQQNANERKEI